MRAGRGISAKCRKNDGDDGKLYRYPPDEPYGGGTNRGLTKEEMLAVNERLNQIKKCI